MNESNLISDGFLLMLTGMGTVFVFLSMLVFLTSIIYRFFGEENASVNHQKKQQNIHDEIAAVSAAVHAYRRRKLNTEE